MKNTALILIIFLCLSCGPKSTSNKMLDMVKNGEVTKEPTLGKAYYYDYYSQFERADLVTYKPYDDFDESYEAILFPDQVDSYEFLSKKEVGPFEFYQVFDLTTDDLTFEDGQRDTALINYLVNTRAAEINDSLLYYHAQTYDQVELKYKITTLSGKKFIYKIELINEDGWKVYYARPES